MWHNRYDTAKIVFNRAKLRIAQNFERSVSQYREAIVREDRVGGGSTDSLFASSWIGSRKSSIYDDDDGDQNSTDHLLFLTAFAKYSARNTVEMRQTLIAMISSPFDVDPITP